MTEKHSPLKVVVGATGKVLVQIDEPLGLFVADCSMTDQGADWAALIVRAMNGLPEAIAALEALCCEDCPPIGYPTDKTRCKPCPRRVDGALTKLKG